MDADPKLLRTGREALDVGYADGVRRRLDGALPCDIAHHLQEEMGCPTWKHVRGLDSPFHSEWRRGFEAGLCGLPPP